MNDVFETETFSKLVEACEKREKEWIEKIKDQLQESLRVGKPLRYDWLREKKLGNKRLFFLINISTKKVVLVAFGGKKEQQKIIDHIILNKERYFRFIS